MKTICSWRPEKTFSRPKKRQLEKTVALAAEFTGCGVNGAVSLNIVSASEMAKLNGCYVGHSGSTDVICFDYRAAGMPRTDGVRTDGDDAEVEVEIAVCPQVALREARKRGLPYSRELMLYIVHGLLHAAGCDDLQPPLKRVMRRREKSVMEKLQKTVGCDDLFPEPNMEESEIL